MGISEILIAIPCIALLLLTCEFSNLNRIHSSMATSLLDIPESCYFIGTPNTCDLQ